MAHPTVVIDYHRLPDRLQRFEQTVVLRTPEVTITYLPAAKLPKPVIAGATVILEPEAPVVWFTYPGEWHDIGRFHLADGRFTGIYANVLTPVEMVETRWTTTDLCLDVWLPIGGAPILLDEEELDEAQRHGWLDEVTAERARAHAAKLLADAESGVWPPDHVAEWTLERVRERLGYSSGSSE